MSLTLVEDVERDILPRITNQDNALGKLLNQPFAATTSGSRRILYEIQYDHAMSLENPEVPIIGTGNEYLFGEKSSSYIKADEDMPIETRMISKQVEFAQRRVEGRNFSIRKNVLKYDDVMNAQREIIYKQRREVLDGENLKNNILNII